MHGLDVAVLVLEKNMSPASKVLNPLRKPSNRTTSLCVAIVVFRYDFLRLWPLVRVSRPDKVMVLVLVLVDHARF